MATARSVCKGVVDVKVRSTDSKDIERMIMMSVHKRDFIVFRWAHFDVGTINASSSGWKSSHVIEILGQVSAVLKIFKLPLGGLLTRSTKDDQLGNFEYDQLTL